MLKRSDNLTTQDSMNYWSKPVENLLQKFNSDLNGLSNDEVKQRISVYGYQNLASLLEISGWPKPGSVKLKIRNEIEEISKENEENLIVQNYLRENLGALIDLVLAKIVAKQVQTVIYEKSFDDLTMGNYRILQAKLNAMGKDINNLKAKYFEVKAPLSLTSFECSECGATLNIKSEEEKFIICEHCDTPFLINWQSK